MLQMDGASALDWQSVSILVQSTKHETAHMSASEWLQLQAHIYV